MASSACTWNERVRAPDLVDMFRQVKDQVVFAAVRLPAKIAHGAVVNPQVLQVELQGLEAQLLPAWKGTDIAAQLVPFSFFVVVHVVAQDVLDLMIWFKVEGFSAEYAQVAVL